MTRRAPQEPASGGIVFVSQFFHPLTVPCVNGYARALHEAGFELTVLCARLDPEWPRSERLNGIRVLRLDPPAGRLGRLRYIARMLRAAFQVVPRPQLIFGNFLDIHGAVAVLTGWLRGVPAVILEHGAGAYEAHTWPLRDRILHRFCLRFAKLVIALSTEDRDRLAASGRKFAAVVPCPFFEMPWAESKVVSRSVLQLSPSEHHVIVAGRLVEVGGVEQKGVTFAIDAVSRLHSCRLHVLGHGELRPQLEAHARALGCADRVSFHGRVPREQVLRFMNAADIVLVPSLYEPLGMVVLEAMYVRTPLVVTNVGGPRDYVRPSVDGLVVPPGDADAIVQAVSSLVGSPALGQRMTMNAAERLKECFSPAVVVDRFLRAVADVGHALR